MSQGNKVQLLLNFYIFLYSHGLQFWAVIFIKICCVGVCIMYSVNTLTVMCNQASFYIRPQSQETSGVKCVFNVGLRIHDPLAMKTVENEKFPHIWCCNLVPRQDRPNKVYIFLKLKKMHTLLGLSWLLMKWHHRNGINVMFQVVFWLKGSCILNDQTHPLEIWQQIISPLLGSCHLIPMPFIVNFGGASPQFVSGFNHT